MWLILLHKNEVTC